APFLGVGTMSNSHRPARPHSPSPRLRLEPLEDRSVPAALLVTDPGDSGPGTLRQAITDANTATGADAITFDPALTGQPSTPPTALPDITDALTITGPGQTALTVQGHAGDRVFQVDTGVTATIADLTVTGGSPTTGSGGGVLNNGTLTLQHVALSG